MDNITEKIKQSVGNAISKHITKFVSDIKDKFYNKSEIDKKIENITVDTTNLLDKQTYDSDDDGVVDNAKKAEKITGLEAAPLFSVYGKSPDGEEGYYEFPIGYIDDQTNKFQSVRQNAKANQIYTVELIKSNKLNDLIIQAYEFTEGTQDVVSTLKEFNNSDASNFYYDKDNLVFTNEGAKIKNEYEVMSTKNEDTGFYELDLSKEEFISNITNISIVEVE